MEQFWFVFCTIIFTLTSLCIASFLVVCIPGLLLENYGRKLIKREIVSILQYRDTASVANMLNLVDTTGSTHTIGAILEELEREGRIQVVSSVSPIHWIPKSHP